jgi:hypothetical protein
MHVAAVAPASTSIHEPGSLEIGGQFPDLWRHALLEVCAAMLSAAAVTRPRGFLREGARFADQQNDGCAHHSDRPWREVAGMFTTGAAVHPYRAGSVPTGYSVRNALMQREKSRR